jgi:hypothetical protein
LGYLVKIHEDLAVPMAPLWGQWIPLLLFCPLESVRDDLSDFVKSLFSDPETKHVNELRELLTILLKNMSSLEKHLASSQESNPGQSYLTLLQWVSDAGRFRGELLQTVVPMVAMWERLIVNREKDATIPLCNFLSSTIVAQFFDAIPVVQFFNMMNNRVNLSLLLKFLPLVPEQAYVQLFITDGFKNLIWSGFSTPEFASTLLEIATGGRKSLILDALWEKRSIDNNLKNSGIYFLQVSWKIITRFPELCCVLRSRRLSQRLV